MSMATLPRRKAKLPVKPRLEQPAEQPAPKAAEFKITEPRHTSYTRKFCITKEGEQFIIIDVDYLYREHQGGVLFKHGKDMRGYRLFEQRVKGILAGAQGEALKEIVETGLENITKESDLWQRLDQLNKWMALNY